MARKIVMTLVLFFSLVGGLLAQPAATSLEFQIKELKEYLMKQPIQRDILLGEGSGNTKLGCSVYKATDNKGEANYLKVERLLEFYAERGGAQYEVQQWTIHLAWIYENCIEGPSPGDPSEDGAPGLRYRPNTLGLEKAFSLYVTANHETAAQRVSYQIAEAYQKLYADKKEDAALVQVKTWLSTAGISSKEIDQRLERLKQQKQRS